MNRARYRGNGRRRYHDAVGNSCRPTVGRVAAIVAVVALLAAGCSDDAAEPPGSTGDPTTTSTVAPSSTSTSSTVPPDPEYRSWIATALPSVSDVIVRSEPAGQPLLLDVTETGTPEQVTIDNPNENGVAATFLVTERGVDAAGTTWHEVLLPVRPNMSRGWINDEDVTLASTDLAVEISVGGHRLTILDEGEAVAEHPVAVGTPENPTPRGTFFIKELLQPPDPTGGYGPLAYGLSGHSPSIKDSAEFPGGVIGIHGTNRPELIGTDVSHGCVRLENAAILDVYDHELPLGTPVTIVD